MRRFQQQSISENIYWQIKQFNFEEIEIYSVVHDVMGISPGLYQNTHLIKAGNFGEKHWLFVH